MMLQNAESNYRKMLVVLETCNSGSVGDACFTRAFRDAVTAFPYTSLYDLYVSLARRTTGSHAGIYNDWYYGNVYRSTFDKFPVLSE